MAKWKVALICVNVGLVVLSAVWGVFAIRNALKKSKAASGEGEVQSEPEEQKSE